MTDRSERLRVRSRSDVARARRIVVKVGSSSISGGNAGQIRPLVDALAAAHARGAEVVLVSSGAIATGIPYLNLDARPTDLATQQAAAAVGQNLLIHRYQDSLDRYSITAAQVLLTAGDLENPAHRANAQRAMERLLGLRLLPIVNENDTVATHEIRFGDNDRLAALVAQFVGADLLVLLSDVDAVYTAPPGRPDAVRITDVAFGEPLDHVEFGDAGPAGVGTGGASTKVAAARLAATSGTAVLIAATGDVARALAGAAVGTWFEADHARADAVRTAAPAADAGSTNSNSTNAGSTSADSTSAGSTDGSGAGAGSTNSNGTNSSSTDAAGRRAG